MAGKNLFQFICEDCGIMYSQAQDNDIYGLCPNCDKKKCNVLCKNCGIMHSQNQIIEMNE